MKIKLLALIFGFVALPIASNAESNSSLMRAGLYKDSKFNIIWDRCSVGQEWNGTTCIGSVQSFTWNDAIGQVNKLNSQKYRGYNDWRLPHIEELNALRICKNGFKDKLEIPAKKGGKVKVDWVCETELMQPNINTQIFPNTLLSSYWSSTKNVDVKDTTWVANFMMGYISSNYVNNKGAIRLVRSGK